MNRPSVDDGVRHWALWQQTLLALALVGGGWLVGEGLRPWLGGRLAPLPLFVALLILVVLVRPGPFLAGVLLAGLGLLARRNPESRLEDVALYAGAVALAGTAAWLSARSNERCNEALGLAEARREALRATLASIGDGVITTDRQGRVAFMNPVASDLTGWSLPEAEGRPLAQVFGIEDEATGQALDSPLEQVIGGSRVPSLGPHTRLLQRGGSTLPIEGSAAPLRERDDAATGMVLVFRDLTPRDAAERERNALVAQLREAGRRKDEFLATLAHELRNPLAPATHALDLLRLPLDEQTAPLHAQARDTLQRQLRHLVRLIDDLLDVGRITWDRLELHRAQVELGDVLEPAAEASRSVLAAAGQTLHLAPAEHPLWLDADAMRLTQAFTNLLGNAGKFSAPGSTVEMSVRHDASHVEVTVRDHGIGIDPAFLPRLFERFEQGPVASGQVRSGLGIGLALARRLVELHGGEIHAHSPGPGRGSCFVVRLPLVAGDARPAPASTGAPTALLAPASKAPAEGWRVLVVDDNPDAAASLALLLELSGNQVRIAHDGVQALAVAGEFLPQIGVLDIGLPRMDGHELARRLRAGFDPAPRVLVALTGWGQAPDRETSAAAGFDAHLVKPVEYAALTRLLEELMARG